MRVTATGKAWCFATWYAAVMSYLNRRSLASATDNVSVNASAMDPSHRKPRCHLAVISDEYRQKTRVSGLCGVTCLRHLETRSKMSWIWLSNNENTTRYVASCPSWSWWQSMHFSPSGFCACLCPFARVCSASYIFAITSTSLLGFCRASFFLWNKSVWARAMCRNQHQEMLVLIACFTNDFLSSWLCLAKFPHHRCSIFVDRRSVENS